MSTAPIQEKAGLLLVNRDEAAAREPISPVAFKQLFIEETIRQCGHEERVGELHVSHLHLPVEVILERLQNGTLVDDETKQKFYRGTWAERGFQERCKALLHAHTLYIDGPRRITAYDGRLVLNIDGSLPYENTLLEYKSVPDKDALAEVMQTRRVGNRIFSQVQGYMLWGNFGRAFVVFETMKEGFVYVVSMLPNAGKQKELRDKVRIVLQKMDEWKRQ